MDRHNLILIILKSLVVIFSTIALIASLILTFSKKMFLKINNILNQNNQYHSSTGEKPILLQNFRFFGMLIFLLSIICFNRINTYFDIKTLTGIFADLFPDKALAEITFSFIKNFLLFTLGSTILISIIIILLPNTFENINNILKKRFLINDKVKGKQYNIDDFIFNNNSIIGITLSALSIYILYTALVKFKIN